MAKYDNPVVNEHVPRMGNALSRGIAQSVLNIMGWKVTGSFPEEKKLIYIGAPHTSNWDLVLAISAMQAVGLRCSWMMKKQAFFWPLGGLFKRLGGVPIDRGAKTNIIEQMADWFNSQDKAYLGMTPEGTRSKVESYKYGYLRMAYAANVPIFLIAIDGENKEIALDKVFQLTGDIEIDNTAIKAYVDANYTGIRPELS